MGFSEFGYFWVWVFFGQYNTLNRVSSVGGLYQVDIALDRLRIKSNSVQIGF